MSGLDPATVMAALRQRGVVVHHTATMPPPVGHPPGVVVFLELTLGQHELASAVASQLPGVGRVTFAGHTRSIMYVAAGLSPTDVITLNRFKAGSEHPGPGA